MDQGLGRTYQPQHKRRFRAGLKHSVLTMTHIALDDFGGTSPAFWQRLVTELRQGSYAAQLKELGLRLTWENPSTPTLGATRYVGNIRFSYDDDDQEHLTVAIRPKVGGSVTGMLRAVQQLQSGHELTWDDRSAEAELYPSTWLARMFIQELELFLARIRPRGEEVEETLVGIVKGQVLVDEYLRRNYVMQPHHVPCRFIELTPDNLPNRILRYALLLSRNVLADAPLGADLELGLARRCEGAFADVQVVQIKRDDLTRVDGLLSAAFVHYRGIIPLARLVILTLDPFRILFDEPDHEQLPLVRIFNSGQTPDGRLKWDLVNMDELFEEYVRLISGGRRGYQPTFDIPLRGFLPSNLVGLSGTRMELDRAPIVTDHARLVIDAKNKHISQINPASQTLVGTPDVIRLVEWQKYRPTHAGLMPISESGQISNQDIYQIVAYATHRLICADAAALVYPTELASHTAAHPQFEGLGYRQGAIGGIPIYILSARIDPEGIEIELRGEGLRHALEHLI